MSRLISAGMAATYPYTTEARIISLMGQLGIDLRTDDSPEAAGDVAPAVEAGTADLDFYLSKYSPSDIASSEWCLQHGTWFAVRWLCLHRLNDLPESVAKECERRMKELELVRQGKAVAPRLPNSRRPGTVTNRVVDLRRFNDTVRVDPTSSTGASPDYRRPTDPLAPDNN